MINYCMQGKKKVEEGIVKTGKGSRCSQEGKHHVFGGVMWWKRGMRAWLQSIMHKIKFKCLKGGRKLRKGVVMETDL
jgi:hypothetical protein